MIAGRSVLEGRRMVARTNTEFVLATAERPLALVPSSASVSQDTWPRAVLLALANSWDI